jgi:hypothetical protein
MGLDPAEACIPTRPGAAPHDLMSEGTPISSETRRPIRIAGQVRPMSGSLLAKLRVRGWGRALPGPTPAGGSEKAE